MEIFSRLFFLPRSGARLFWGEILSPRYDGRKSLAVIIEPKKATRFNEKLVNLSSISIRSKLDLFQRPIEIWQLILWLIVECVGEINFLEPLALLLLINVTPVPQNDFIPPGRIVEGVWFLSRISMIEGFFLRFFPDVIQGIDKKPFISIIPIIRKRFTRQIHRFPLRWGLSWFSCQ